MKIVLLGKNGQVGWELQRSLAPLANHAAGQEGLIALDRHCALCGDLSHPDALAQTIIQLRPDVIVNAAAYTAVDLAEQEAAQAYIINATAPAKLAQAAQQIGALLVHYSSDYVFNGSGNIPWLETDTPDPINTYGRSKLAGEQAITESGCRHLIFRTSWVYASRGQNFIQTMLKLAQERETLSVIDDQRGAPTGADLIADVTAHALHHLLKFDASAARPSSGIYHLSAAGHTTWHAYASHAIAYARSQYPSLPWKVKAILPVPSSAWKTTAARPLNSRLNGQKLAQQWGLHMPTWQSGVERTIDELWAR